MQGIPGKSIDTGGFADGSEPPPPCDGGLLRKCNLSVGVNGHFVPTVEEGEVALGIRRAEQRGDCVRVDYLVEWWLQVRRVDTLGGCNGLDDVYNHLLSTQDRLILDGGYHKGPYIDGGT